MNYKGLIKELAIFSGLAYLVRDNQVMLGLMIFAIAIVIDTHVNHYLDKREFIKFHDEMERQIKENPEIISKELDNAYKKVKKDLDKTKEGEENGRH